MVGNLPVNSDNNSAGAVAPGSQNERYRAFIFGIIESADDLIGLKGGRVTMIE